MMFCKRIQSARRHCHDDCPNETRVKARQSLISAKLVSTNRIVAENAIGHMRKWKAVSAVLPFRQSSFYKKGSSSVTLDAVLKCVWQLTNFQMVDVPLRSLDWRPQKSSLDGYSYGYPFDARSPKQLEAAINQLYQQYLVAVGKRKSSTNTRSSYVAGVDMSDDESLPYEEPEEAVKPTKQASIVSDSERVRLALEKMDRSERRRKKK